MDASTANLLYSSAISIGAYGLWKTVQSIYHRYYLTSDCVREGRTLEITIVEREPAPAPAPAPASASEIALAVTGELAREPRSRAPSEDAAGPSAHQLEKK